MRQYASEYSVKAPTQPAGERGPQRTGQRREAKLEVDQSPRVLAQRRKIKSAFGSAVQLRDKPESNTTGMPNALKAGIESLSGIDMSGVSIHRNSVKPAQLHALAFAQGDDVHVGPRQEQHLPHELWHVVQQRQGRVRATTRVAGVGVNDEGKLEREADLMGQRAALRWTGSEASQSRHQPAMWNRESAVVTGAAGGSANAVLQGVFILSKSRRTPVDDTVLDAVGMHLRGHSLYAGFAHQRNHRKKFSLLGWLNDKRGELGDMHSLLSAIAEGKSLETQDEDDIQFIADGHYDAPGSSAGPLKYLTDKRSELIPWLFDGNRVKMQQTAGRIRSSAKKEDWSAIRVNVGQVLLLHKIDGPAAAKSQQRENQIVAWLQPGGRGRKKSRRAGRAARANLRDGFTFALQKAIFGEANIKIAIDPDGRKISLDGVGRVRAVLGALTRLGRTPDQCTMDVLAIRITPEEYHELEEIHAAYYDEAGKQRKEEQSLGGTPGIVRTIASPLGKLYNWWQGGNKQERDLGKSLAEDRSRFFRNNCLIVAMADAAGVAQPSAQQIIQIRTQIHQPVGGMLLATPEAINLVRQILGITRPVAVTYTHLLGTPYVTENFVGAGGPPLVVHHANNHFYHPPGATAELNGRRGETGWNKNEPLDERARANVGLMGTPRSSAKELNLALRAYEEQYRARYQKDLQQTTNSKGYAALDWLHRILSADEFQHMCNGAQIRLKYTSDLFEGLRRMNAEPRKSSHYSGIIIPTELRQVPDEHFGIDGDFFPTVLFGSMQDNEGRRFIYIQAERNSYNPSAGKLEKLHHVFDASDYAWSQENQGPYGTSSYTDANPLGDEKLAAPGRYQRWHPRRLKAVALMLLKPHLVVPAVLNAIPDNVKRMVPAMIFAVLLHGTDPIFGPDHQS